MSFVSTEEFQRLGREVNAEMSALDEAVDRTWNDKRKLGADRVPFPDGPWWQRWQGFHGSWTQYYEEQVKPTPIMPWHDDGDLREWGRQLDTWKDDFNRGQAENAKRQLGGPVLPTVPTGKSDSSFGLGGLLTSGLVVGAVLAVGYLVSSTANLKRSFT